jgi:hypothetical protein
LSDNRDLLLFNICPGTGAVDLAGLPQVQEKYAYDEEEGELDVRTITLPLTNE